ncbi:hypothetical protein LIER_27979 [Lithospermum erythrorhizon]|uniref:Flavin-containing monooxygenase n=1 Tax=Lithospermum erythrorhizon TaxID=34254 RepID=A0AAV3RFJ7_LITER
MTLKVLYGGTFTLNPLCVYENDQLRTIDFVSMDTFNLLDIDVIVVATGYKYKSPVMYLWLVGDSGFETDSDTEVVLVKCPVLMLEYVHDQGDGDVGGVVALGGDVDRVMGPGENLEGLVGLGEDVDGVVGPERDVNGVVGPGEPLDGVMGHGDDLDGVNAHGEDELDVGMDPPMDDVGKRIQE